MAKFCLIHDTANKFLDLLDQYDPETLFKKMSTEDRNKLFSSISNDQIAKDLNTRLEMALDSKKKNALTDYIGKTVREDKQGIKNDLINRVKNSGNLADPKNEELLLKDMARKKLGIDLTKQQAKTISDLTFKLNDNVYAKNTSKLLEEFQKLPNDRMTAEQKNIISDLQDRLKKEGFNDQLSRDINRKLKDIPISQETKTTIQDLTNKVGESLVTGDNYGSKKVALENFVSNLENKGKITNLAGIPKALKATLSDHALGRQGLPVLFTHPRTWLRNAGESFANIVRVIGGKNAVDATRAYMYNDPMFEEMKKAGLAINMKGEEAYPTDLPAKVPVLGRLYKSSKQAFEIFNATNRFDLYKQLKAIGENGGFLTKTRDMSDPEEQKALATMINSLTGRGNLKGTGTSTLEKGVNATLFSPRLLKSHIDILTAHSGQGLTPFAKAQARKNLIKMIGGVAAIIALANAIRPGSAPTDTNNSDFGKIKAGDTRFDYTGGISSIVTLASRLLTHSSTSSTTGKVTPLDAKNPDGSAKFGAKTTQDVISEAIQGRLSPAASTALMLRTGTDSGGKKTTLGSATSNLLMPLPVEGYEKLKSDPNAANVLAGLLAEGVGIGVNTYAPATPSISAQVKAIKQAQKTPAEIAKDAQTAAKAKITRLKNQQTILNQGK